MDEVAVFSDGGIALVQSTQAVRMAVHRQDAALIGKFALDEADAKAISEAGTGNVTYDHAKGTLGLKVGKKTKMIKLGEERL